MTSKNAPPPPPKSSVTSKTRDPLELARTLAEQFSALSAEFELARGIRDRLYAFLQGNYLLGTFYKERPDDYRRFSNEEYWRQVRQKPNERNVMRSVLAFTMRTREPGREALQNRIIKYAKVLEYFYQIEAISEEIPQRLKAGGGIDVIYAALCRDARPPEGRGGGREEATAELPLARTGAGTTDAPAPASEGPLGEGEIDGDGHPRDDDRGRLAVEGRRKSVSPATAANDATDMLRGKVQAAGRSKRGQLPGTLRRVILQVEMFEFELEEYIAGKTRNDLREC